MPSESTPLSADGRAAMKRWLENWRAVNEAQDELVRSEPPRDSARCLEDGLSLIAFGRRMRDPGVARDRREADVETVRRAWRQLRLARGR